MTPRNWFITGTSSGFGRALTENLLARGDRVAATVRKVKPSKTSRLGMASNCGWLRST